MSIYLQAWINSKAVVIYNGILQFSVPTEATPNYVLHSNSPIPDLLWNRLERRSRGTKGKDPGLR